MIEREWAVHWSMEKEHVAADSLSGFLIACALVMPSKDLEDVRVKSIKKKFKSIGLESLQGIV